MANTLDDYKALAAQLRSDSIRCTTAAGSGHPTSSMSAADLMAVLLMEHLHYDFNDPHNVRNDRLIFSKGHAAPLLYSMYKAAGAITDEQLLSLRKFGSPIEGHPVPEPNGLPYVDVATGSLGQGLPASVGMAWASKNLLHTTNKMWVVLGDSEMAEGSNYEAMELAGFYQLNNIIAIIDNNRLGQRGPTMLQWHTEAYKARAESFGWHAIVIDGHDVDAIQKAFEEASEAFKPVCIVAQTKKGKGVSFTEDIEGYHGKAIPQAEEAKALAELGNPKGDILVKVKGPRNMEAATLPASAPFQPPHYEKDKKVATREAYGDALVALGHARSTGMSIVLDGEVSATPPSRTSLRRSSRSASSRSLSRSSNSFQLRLSASQALQQDVPFCLHLCSLLRARLTIRSVWRRSRSANINLAGSHAGVSIGEDGASQMALEDLSMHSAPCIGSSVLYPSCATTTGSPGCADGDPQGHQLHENHAGEDADSLWAGRIVPDWRQQNPALL